eukprot:scaffold29564_cov60-Phaeocystis_antarctica.AAC.4
MVRARRMHGDHVSSEGVEAGAEDGARVEQHTKAPLDAVAHLCTYIHIIYGGGYILRWRQWAVRGVWSVESVRRVGRRAASSSSGYLAAHRQQIQRV